MPGAELHDTKYLQGLVGEALSRGCAAVAAAHPTDPVEYLGQWLLRFVKNAQVVGDIAKEKETQLEARKKALEAEEEAKAKAKAAEEERRAAVLDLANTVAEPRELLQKAVDLIVKFTAAGAAYAAVVAEPEEADWQYPEDPEDPAAVESEDEADPLPPPPAEGGEEGAPAEEAAPPAEEAPVEDAEAGPPKIPKPVDYSKKYLSYLAASAGQEFINVVELTRPAPPPEDDPEAPQTPTPFTFRVLDEKRPLVYTPNVAFESNVHFFKGFPKVGAYQAVGVQAPGTGEFKAVVAADTLFPEASGQPLPQDDQDFIWHVSRALSQAYDAVEKQSAATVEGKDAGEAIEALKKAIHDIYFPPPPEPSPDAPPVAATPPPPPVDEGAEGEAPPAEPEPGDDPVSQLKAEVKVLEEALHTAEGERAKAAEALEVSQKVLAAVNDAVAAAGEAAVPLLRVRREVPQATFHVLKAVAHVLHKDPDSLKNWKRAFVHFQKSFFDEVHEFDATQDRDLDAWKAARACYKALPAENADKALAAEFPESHVGVLLLMWLKQARKVGRRAAAFRAAFKAEDDVHHQLDAKREELEAAEKIKAEEEEAARLAAEAEAAAAAAAAEAEGGEGGEEGGEDAAE